MFLSTIRSRHAVTAGKALLCALVLITVSFALPQAQTRAASAAVQTQVSSSVQWVNTGITLSLGEKLSVSATGSWSTDVNLFPNVGPDGYTQQAADNFLNLTDLGACSSCASTQTPHWGALIGYIGNNPPTAGSYTSTSILPDAQKVFVVGSNFQSGAPFAGTLWLNFNDDAYSANTGDNAGQVTANITVTSPVVPGGTWISPQSPNQFTARGNIFYFAAHAYPTHAGDPKIARVNFTATWPGANWRVACSSTQIAPGTSDWYECNWNIAKAGVPNGPLTVSFDVYDTSGNVNYAPNGEHQGTVNRSAHWCECVIYVENHFGLSDPTSICCGVNGYAKDMGPYLQARRFRQVSTPQVGAVIIFQPGFGSGIDQTAGHVGIISSVKSVGNKWAITVEGSHQQPPEYTKDNCTNVSNISFAPYPKSDTFVSYWIR